LRIARGWTQEEVAQRMGAYGYDWHQTIVGRLETAQRPLRLNEAVALASLFEVPVDSLLFAISYRPAEEVDAEIKGLRKTRELARVEWEKALARYRELERDLEAARYEADRYHAMMTIATTRIEGLELKYGKRS
jgi:transcriptional regulator with XRE-family HTH domain